MLLNPPDVINIRTFSSDNIYFCGKKSDTYTSFSIPFLFNKFLMDSVFFLPDMIHL